MAGWTARELARLTNVPVPTVSAWINAGLIVPQHYGRGRNGHTIGLAGLIELITIIELRAAGFSLQRIQKVVENLRQMTGENRPLAQLTLVVVGKDIYWKEEAELTDTPVSALCQPGQRVMLFPIGEKQTKFLEQLRDSHVFTNVDHEVEEKAI